MHRPELRALLPALRGRLRPVALVALLAAGGCLPVSTGPDAPEGSARLRVEPGPRADSLGPGQHPLGLGGARDGILHLPAGYRPGTPTPLLVMLHGAGGDAAGLAPLFAVADDLGVAMLVPESRGRVWDGTGGRYGPDVEFVGRALSRAFERASLDPRRVALAGFSNGGTYALALGLSNGDLFSYVIALSPGFVVPPEPRGRPRVFVAHGTHDPILPVSLTRGRIVSWLTGAGYEVRFHEFDGGHVISAGVVKEALRWLVP